VTVDYGASAIRVEVTDTGRGLAGPTGLAGHAGHAVPAGSAGSAGGATGHGLRGMRERAAAAGGTLETGPRPAGGFRVAATLPLDDHWPVPAEAAAAGRAAPTQKAG
jgi:two-component system sensor histidine kinase DesK